MQVEGGLGHCKKAHWWYGSTELEPIVRLRALKPRRADQHPLPLSFTFVSRSRLATAQSRTVSTSSSPSGRSLSGSPTKLPDRVGRDQDVLIFDPEQGMPSLHRLTPSKHSHEPVSNPLGMPPPRSSARTSFPTTVGSLHRLAGSAGAHDGARQHQPSALTRMMSGPSQLTCQAVRVATWTLRRSVDWKEVKSSFVAAASVRPSGAPHKSE